MFNLFKKKEGGTKVIDKILMTQTAKWKALAEQWKKNNDIVFICWFDETKRQAEAAFANETSPHPELYATREIHASQLTDKKVIFIEHYPLAQKEKELFEKLQLTEVQVWSALDEPLFKEFGSDKIVQMMKQLGMKEDNVVEHSMISKSIHNAQEKIEKKIQAEQTCPSQKEWMEMNWRNS